MNAGEVIKSPVIDLPFGDVSLKFQVFIDKDGLERGYFDVSCSKKINYKGKEYEPFNGRYYINNLYRLYLILYEAMIQSKKLSNYTSKIKRDIKAGYSFNIRRIRMNEDQRANVLKDYYNFYVNSKGNQDNLQKEHQEDKNKQEEEEIFDVPVLDLNVQEKMQLNSAKIKQKHIQAIHESFSELPYNLNVDMYSVFPAKFLRKNSIVSVYYAFFPRRRIILEFRENKTPVKYTRIFLEMHQIIALIDLIETFLQSVPNRKRVVYPHNEDSNGSKPNPILINKEGDIRRLSILPLLTQETELNIGQYYILKNALKDYIQTGIVPKVPINSNASFFIGENSPYILISGRKFKIEGRKHALEVLYNLL